MCDKHTTGEMRTLERFVQKLHADVELTQQKETSWEAEQRTKQVHGFVLWGSDKGLHGVFLFAQHAAMCLEE